MRYSRENIGLIVLPPIWITSRNGLSAEDAGGLHYRGRILAPGECALTLPIKVSISVLGDSGDLDRAIARSETSNILRRYSFHRV